MTGQPEPRPPLADLIAALDAAEADVRESPDAMAVYERATALLAELRHRVAWPAAQRAEAAAKIRDEAALSIAQLADVLGLSKPRADELLRAARGERDTWQRSRAPRTPKAPAGPDSGGTGGGSGEPG